MKEADCQIIYAICFHLDKVQQGCIFKWKTRGIFILKVRREITWEGKRIGGRGGLLVGGDFGLLFLDLGDGNMNVCFVFFKPNVCFMYICHISQIKNEEANQVMVGAHGRNRMRGMLGEGRMVWSWMAAVGFSPEWGPSACGLLPPGLHRAGLHPQRGLPDYPI